MALFIAFANNFLCLSAPGPMADFNIVLHFSGSFELIQLRWKLPHLLDRNGIIDEFLLVDNSSIRVSPWTISKLLTGKPWKARIKCDNQSSTLR